LIKPVQLPPKLGYECGDRGIFAERRLVAAIRDEHLPIRGCHTDIVRQPVAQVGSRGLA
jgi:hypothetical protein